MQQRTPWTKPARGGFDIAAARKILGTITFREILSRCLTLATHPNKSPRRVFRRSEPSQSWQWNRATEETTKKKHQAHSARMPWRFWSSLAREEGGKARSLARRKSVGRRDYERATKVGPPPGVSPFDFGSCSTRSGSVSCGETGERERERGRESDK